MQAVMDQGCNAFLPKPFTLGQVTNILRQVLTDSA
jgi:hypothetical protein